MKKILVVEDNEDNMLLVKSIFQGYDYIIIEATDGVKGVELAIKEKPDLILMDVQLPDINGLEATRRIRASEAGGEIPIVALTSLAMAGDKERAVAAGCTGYIEKPIDPDTFITEIEKYL